MTADFITGLAWGIAITIAVVIIIFFFVRHKTQGMKPEKVLEVIERYRQFFTDKGIDQAKYPENKLLDNTENGLAHCHGILNEMVEFVHESRMGKVFRWLGFIQGVLFAFRLFTLADLMNHNRPNLHEQELKKVE